jgi:ceramide glucosyltransferase
MHRRRTDPVTVMTSVFNAAQDLLIVLILAANIYYLLCIISAYQFFQKKSEPLSSETPAVTILIPLSGADFEAYENYASFCKQDYPLYQIVFGVQEESDPAVQIVHQITKDFPDCDISLSISSTTIGLNLKVSNLQNMVAFAKYDILAVVDSDIRVGEEYLRNIVSELSKERVGLVTCLYRGIRAGNLAAKLEAIGITSEFASGVLVARLLEGIKFALGATLATKREVLDRIGGFPALADYLADDFMLGNLISDAGFEVRLSPYVVKTVLASPSFWSMVKHQVRWARGTRICRPKSYLGLLFTYGTPLALLNLVFPGHLLPGWILLGFTLLMRLFASWTVGVRGLKDPIPKKYFWLVPAREILSLGIWCWSLVGKTVEWRGQILELMKDGKIRTITNKKVASVAS